jgi:small-conductance mechanosensitive channel
VSNSFIGKNQTVNCTLPDSRDRIQTLVGIGYGTDIDTAEDAIVDAVQQVERVVLDKAVGAVYIEMGDSAVIARVRWWIE